jgi:hypothetical protein
VSPGSGIRKVGNAILWTFSKQEVDVLLSRMERLKTLIQNALEMDHFVVPFMALHKLITNFISKLSRASKASVDALHNDNQVIKDGTSISGELYQLSK